MQSENPLIADFVKLANAAAGTFAGMTREAREGARDRLKGALGGMDLGQLASVSSTTRREGCNLSRLPFWSLHARMAKPR